MSAEEAAVVEEKDLSTIWWVLLMYGITTLILGVLLILAPGVTLTTLALFIGIYWLISGLISFVEIFVKSSNVHWGWLLFNGILGVVAGIFVLRHPLISPLILLTVLVIVLGVNGLIMGFIGLVRGFSGDGFGTVILGILNIIIGLILLGRPFLAASVLPLVIGIFAIIGGIVNIAYSLRLRPAEK